MTTLAEAFVRLRPDTSQMGPEIRKGTEAPATESGRNAGHHFGTAMAQAAKAALVGLAVGSAIVGQKTFAFLKQATADASDLNETISKSQQIFPKTQAQIQKFASTSATSLGLSKQAALEGAASFGNFFNQIGIGEKQSANMSIRLIQLASDLASFNNADPTQVMDAFLSATRGEYDALQTFIPTINAATVEAEALRLTHKKSVKQLTDADKAQALYSLSLRDAGKAQGDFARTSDGLANQQRILKANFANLRAEIGVALLPVVTHLTTTINTKLMPVLFALWAQHGPQVVAWLQTATTKFGALIDKVSANDFAVIRDQVSGLGDSLSKVDWATLWASITNAIQTIKDEGPGFNETLSVSRVVIGFLADHADILAKALPYLAAGFILVKTAQLASNAAEALSPAITLFAAAANRRLAASNVELAAAISASKVATVTGTGATVVATSAENVSMLTRIRSTAATVASTVASVVARGATLAWAGVQWLLNAALSANPIGLVVIAVLALAAGIIYAYKHSETFRNIVDATWKLIRTVIVWAWKTAIEPIFNQFVDLIMKGIVPASIWLWEKAIRPTWNGISGAIRDAWNNVIRPTFTFLKDMILVTIPDAFRRGIDAVGGFWGQLKSLAATPVRFVVETVINKGIIGTFNKVSGFFHGPTFAEVPMPGGLGDGPGPGTGGAPAARTGDGLGDILDLVRGPAKWITDRVGLGGIAAKFGNNPFTQMLTGAGGALKDALIERAKALIGASSDPGGGGGASASTGGLQAGILGVLGALRAMFGNVAVISGFRPGSRTLTGNVSYHASGRAIDIAPVLGWARFLNAVYGSRLRELITPWNELNIHNGRPHQYTGAVWNQHNFAGGNAHIHAAMDSGGWLLPGLNVVPNGTGRPELVTPPSTMDDVLALLRLLIEAVERIAPGVGREFRGASTAMLADARRR